jgi:hypothetical protein
MFLFFRIFNKVSPLVLEVFLLLLTGNVLVLFNLKYMTSVKHLI